MTSITTRGEPNEFDFALGDTYHNLEKCDKEFFQSLDTNTLEKCEKLVNYFKDKSNEDSLKGLKTLKSEDLSDLNEKIKSYKKAEGPTVSQETSDKVNNIYKILHPETHTMFEILNLDLRKGVYQFLSDKETGSIGRTSKEFNLELKKLVDRKKHELLGICKQFILKIQDGQTKQTHLNGLLNIHLQLNDFEGAKKIAQLMINTNGANEEIINRYLFHDNIAEAEKIPHSRQIDGQLLKHKAAVGDVEGTKELFQKLNTSVDQKNYYLALAYAVAGDVDKAKEEMNKISDNEQKNSIVYDLINNKVSKDVSNKILVDFIDNKRFYEAWPRLAAFCARQDDMKKASDIFIAAKEYSAHFLGKSQRNDYLNSIATNEIRSGLLSDAKKTMKLIDDENKINSLIDQLIEKHLDEGDVEGLTKTLNEFNYEIGEQHFESLLPFIKKSADYKDYDKAKNVANLLQSDFLKTFTSILIARGYAKNYDFESAQNIMDSLALVPNVDDEMSILLSLEEIKALADIGNINAAKEKTEKIPSNLDMLKIRSLFYISFAELNKGLNEDDTNRIKASEETFKQAWSMVENNPELITEAMSALDERNF